MTSSSGVGGDDKPALAPLRCAGAPFSRHVAMDGAALRGTSPHVLLTSGGGTITLAPWPGSRSTGSTRLGQGLENLLDRAVPVTSKDSWTEGGNPGCGACSSTCSMPQLSEASEAAEPSLEVSALEEQAASQEAELSSVLEQLVALRERAVTESCEKANWHASAEIFHHEQRSQVPELAAELNEELVACSVRRREAELLSDELEALESERAEERDQLAEAQCARAADDLALCKKNSFGRSAHRAPTSPLAHDKLLKEEQLQVEMLDEEFAERERDWQAKVSKVRGFLTEGLRSQEALQAELRDAERTIAAVEAVVASSADMSQLNKAAGRTTAVSMVHM